MISNADLSKGRKDPSVLVDWCNIVFLRSIFHHLALRRTNLS